MNSNLNNQPTDDPAAEVQHSADRLENEMPRLHPNSAINSKVMKGKAIKTQRAANRAAANLMTDLESACTKHINMFFKFMESRPTDDQLKAEMIRIDSLWKAWLRTKNVYFFLNCKDYFATKLQFLIGEKKVNESVLAEMEINWGNLQNKVS
jgi:hypothetical protein